MTFSLICLSKIWCVKHCDSKVQRDDILSSFLSTKDYHTKGFVRYTIELFNSGNVVLYFWPPDLDNFDFYLRCDFEEAWREMEKIKRELLEKRKILQENIP